MHEIKTLIDAQSKAIADFKKNYNVRLGELEAKMLAGTDPLLEEKVDRANGELSALTGRLASLEKHIARGPLAHGLPSGATEFDTDTTKHKTGGHFMNNISYQTKNLYGRFLRTGDRSCLEELHLEGKSLSVFSSPDGGFAVPEELNAALNNYLFDANVMRQISTVVQSHSADYKIAVNTGGMAAGWVGETSTRAETGTPSIGQVSFPTGELYCNPAATQWMIDDAGFDLVTWLMNEINGKFAAMEGISFISGSANNQPRGVLDFPSSTVGDDSRPFGTLKHTVTAGATAITFDEMIGLTYDLRGPYRRNGVFVMNSATAGYLQSLKNTTTSDYIWQPSLQAGQPAAIAGYKVMIDEAMPDIAAGAVAVMFGDFKAGYMIVDRTPLRVLRDNYTNKPYTHFYCTKRVSGMVVDTCAIRLLKQHA
jgi:HK97 family phage major capsid protein